MDLLENVVDEVLFRNINGDPEYIDFTESINGLSDVILEMDEFRVLTEDVDGLDEDGKKKNPAKTVAKAAKNTVKTTNVVKGAYGNITDVGGAAYKGIWMLVWKAAAFVTKIIKFIFKNIMKLIKAIPKLGEKVSNIPDAVRKKIRGSINLNISWQDLVTLIGSDNAMLNNIDKFITDAVELIRSPEWEFVLKGREARKDKQANKQAGRLLSTGAAKRMQGYYAKFKAVKIEPRPVDMADGGNVNTYFGTRTFGLKIDGKVVERTYFQGLQILGEIVKRQESAMKSIEQQFSTKFTNVQDNGVFDRLDVSYQHDLQTCMQMISKGVEIVGNVVKGITADLKTLSLEIDRIVKYREKLEGDGLTTKVANMNKDKAAAQGKASLNQTMVSANDKVKEYQQKGMVKVSLRDLLSHVPKDEAAPSGAADPYNRNFVWVLKTDLPKGVKTQK